MSSDKDITKRIQEYIEREKKRFDDTFDIYEHVRSVLKELGLRENIVILFASEVSSRIWGVESEDSDYDVKFIYYRPLKHYLTLDRQLEHKKERLKRHIRFTDSSYNIEYMGTDIYSFIDLFLKSNPGIVEQLHSPSIYICKDSELMRYMIDISGKNFSKRAMMSHYISMAKENYNKYIHGENKIPYKRYLYAFRGIFYALWTRDMDILPSMNLIDDIDKYDIPTEIRDIILEVIIPSKKSGKKTTTSIRVLDEFIFDNIRTIGTHGKSTIRMSNDDVEQLLMKEFNIE